MTLPFALVHLVEQQWEILLAAQAGYLASTEAMLVDQSDPEPKILLREE